MDNKCQIIEIYLNKEQKGEEWYIQGPQDYTFYIKPLKKILTDEMELIRYLPIMDKGRIILPALTNSFVLAITATTLNPQVAVTLVCLDAKTEKFLKTKTTEFDNISTMLISDIEPFSEELQVAILPIRQSTDRLLVFDLIERLSSTMPPASLLIITSPTTRRKDLFTKLSKHLKSVLSDKFLRKGGTILYGLTEDIDHNWTSRQSQEIIKIQEGEITLYTRPGCGYNSIRESGLALAESIDFIGDEQILEINCANGLTSMLLAKRMQVTNKLPQQIILIDSRIRSIEMSQKNIIANNFNFIKANLATALIDQKFNIIIIHGSHFKDTVAIEKLIQTAKDLLNKNGEIYLISKHHELYHNIAKKYNLTTSCKKRRGYQITICKQND